MEGTFLASTTIEQYRAQLAAAPLSGESISSLLRMLSGAADGYAVVRLGNIADALGAGNQFLRVATAIPAELAVQFRHFARGPLPDPGEYRGHGPSLRCSAPDSVCSLTKASAGAGTGEEYRCRTAEE